MQSFDVVVIGGGPGGYVAAIRASQLGMKTALIEREHLGGICLNWGCIPTKSLLRCAEVKHLIDNAKEFGMTVKGLDVDIVKMVERSRQTSSKLNQGIGHLLKKNKVTVFNGHGQLLKNKQILMTPTKGDKETIEAKNIIIATGAKARTLPNYEIDGELFWTARHAMTPKKMPKSILVIGSGAIGIEFASFYKTFGVEVHVVEMMDRILPQEDKEISAFALKSFQKQGIHFYLKSSLKDLKKQKGYVEVTLEHEGKNVALKVDHVLFAIGIVGNTEGLGLENTVVKVEKNQIVVNEFCETHEKGIYAIGDVAGAPWLAHKASHEGILCVDHIKGHQAHPMVRSNIPGCTYSLPQVASIGMSEDVAKEKGYKVRVGKFPYQANGKALALGEPEGLIKTIFDEKTGELLGAHMIGAEVTELVQGFAIAKQLETTEAELMETIFPHPTLSEMMHESVLDAFKRAIHI